MPKLSKYILIIAILVMIGITSNLYETWKSLTNNAENLHTHGSTTAKNDSQILSKNSEMEQGDQLVAHDAMGTQKTTYIQNGTKTTDTLHSPQSRHITTSSEANSDKNSPTSAILAEASGTPQSTVGGSSVIRFQQGSSSPFKSQVVSGLIDPQTSKNSVTESAVPTYQPRPPIPVAYALQTVLNDPTAPSQATQLLHDPASQAQLEQIASDFVQRVNASKDSPYSAAYANNYSQSVDLADQQFYSTYGQEAYLLWEEAQAAAAGQ